MPSSYLLVMPYASGSGGNPVSGISLNDGDEVNVTLLGRVCARWFRRGLPWLHFAVLFSSCVGEPLWESKISV